MQILTSVYLANKENIMIKRKHETVEDILDRIEEDINAIREKCICNGEDSYEPEDDDDDSFDDEDDE